jgi:hypothetical protein
MIKLLLAAEPNPEVWIKAAMAATAAKDAATMAFYLLVAVLIVVTVGTVIAWVVLKRVAALEYNTDGMREQLVDATHKLGVIEGKVAGRAEEKAEQRAEQKREDASLTLEK